MLINRTLRRIEIVNAQLLLVHKAVLLKINFRSFQLSEIHLLCFLLPICSFFSKIQIHLRTFRCEQFCVFTRHLLSHFLRILHAPRREIIRVPVVVNVVLVFIRTGYAKHDIRLFRFRPIHTLRPETRNANQHIYSVFTQMSLVARVLHIVVNGIRYCSVAMNFLKRNLPLVVTLFSVHGHHRIQRSTVLESQLRGILNGFV